MSTLGPYSRTLRRGTIGASIDGRSTIGRYIRDLERQLVRHVGGPSATLASLTIAQQLLIERLVKTTVQINLLDDRFAAGPDRRQRLAAAIAPGPPRRQDDQRQVRPACTSAHAQRKTALAQVMPPPNPVSRRWSPSWTRSAPMAS